MHKEHTDQLLCTVINNVVVWLKKKKQTHHRSKEEALLMHTQTRAEITGTAHRTGGNNESLVLRSIYEVFFAPLLHIL